MSRYKLVLPLAVALLCPLPLLAETVSADERAYGLPGDPGLDEHGVRINRPAPLPTSAVDPDVPTSPRSAEELFRQDAIDRETIARANAYDALANPRPVYRSRYGYPRYYDRPNYNFGLSYTDDDGFSGYLNVGNGSGYHRPRPLPEKVEKNELKPIYSPFQ